MVGGNTWYGIPVKPGMIQFRVVWHGMGGSGKVW